MSGRAWPVALLVVLLLVINFALTILGDGLQRAVELVDQAQPVEMLERAAARLERVAHDAELKRQNANGPRHAAAWQVMGATAADHAELLRARAEGRPYEPPDPASSKTAAARAASARASWRVDSVDRRPTNTGYDWQYWAGAVALALATLTFGRRSALDRKSQSYSPRRHNLGNKKETNE